MYHEPLRCETLSLERAVTYRFGDVADFNSRRAFEIGDRARDTCQPVQSAGREVAVCSGITQQRDRIGIERAMAAHITRADGCVGLPRASYITFAL